MLTGTPLAMTPFGPRHMWTSCERLTPSVGGDAAKVSAKRRAVTLACLFGLGTLGGCIWPRFFTLAWTEQVRLHDGTVMPVRVTYTYERLGFRLLRYDAAMLRSTQIAFDAGPGIGRSVRCLKSNGSTWSNTSTARGTSCWRSRDRADGQHAQGWKEKWGPPENGAGHQLWRLRKSGLERSSIYALPDDVLRVNLLINHASAAELSKFDGTLVTLDEKAKYAAKFPFDPDR